MKTERGYGSSHFFSEKYLDGFLSRPSSTGNGYAAAAATISTSSSSNSSPSSPGIGSCIEHRVSKMDTLAGIAIKYGVEVAGIRRMNGLVTDLQMFALESLQIPLPGRHPPSPASATNGEQTHRLRPHDDLLDSLQSLKLKPTCKVSPARSTLHDGYYGLPTPKTGPLSEGTEMAVYKTARVVSLEDGLLPRESPASDPDFSQPRKSSSLVFLENGDLSNEIAESGDGSEADRSIRRHQNVEVDTSVRTPEILLKEDDGGGFTVRTGKGLALRPKLGSRTDMDASWQNAAPIADPFMGDLAVSVQKSSSTSNLQGTETTYSSIWPTGKWSDAIARPMFDGFPMFDGLPKPMTGRRTKAALD